MLPVREWVKGSDYIVYLKREFDSEPIYAIATLNRVTWEGSYVDSEWSMPDELPGRVATCFPILRLDFDDR